MSVTLWPRAIAYSTCSGPVKPVPPRIRMSSGVPARSIGARRSSSGITLPNASFGAAPSPVAPKAPAPATAAETLRNVRRSVDTNDLPGGGGLDGNPLAFASGGQATVATASGDGGLGGRRSALLLFLVELQRGAVEAVAQPCRLWPIVEQVAEVAAALGAVNLGPTHVVARVDVGFHGIGSQRSEEARPARTGIELRVRVEQRLAAAHALVHAVLLGVPVLAGEGPFGALLAGDSELFGGELY